MRNRTAISAILVMAALAAVGAIVVSWKLGDGFRLPLRSSCLVTTASDDVRLTPARMANAATIAAVGIRRGVPRQGIVVALATASQESKLDNLAGGDRDSVGLFQQRPSQGWGTPEQIADPRYAANAFYSALLKVRGWQEMRVTDAAQAVQNSAHPELYQQWQQRSEVLANALTGDAGGAVACTLSRKAATRGSQTAETLAESLRLDWGDIGTELPPDASGIAVPVPDAKTGWRYAHWLVSHASGRGITKVSFGEMRWTASGGEWRQESPDESGGDRVVAEVQAA